ncbi:MAG: hypothetical protein KIT84_20100 [Labilithrix sp.]|nr:hypothetical protein [Labilithrix sp.]
MIELDAPVPELEGQRVRLIVETVDESADPKMLQAAWDAWLVRSPDGPIVDEDDDPEFP